jgi:quercetin dioxygenase-like cupin family protein
MTKPTKEKILTDPWPVSLDAIKAAPDHHDVLLENDQVRVLDTVIKVGATVPVHTHRWSSVMYVLSFSDFVRYDADGKVLVDTRNLPGKPQVGEAMWSSPLPPHSLQNVGSADLRLITVELKGDA